MKTVTETEYHLTRTVTTQPLVQKRQLRDRGSFQPPVWFQKNIAEVSVSETYQEAVTDLEALEWTQVIKEELRAHEANDTWKLIPSEATNHIDSKWVFKIQRIPSEQIRYKAHLCARGCKQKIRHGYFEIFFLLGTIPESVVGHCSSKGSRVNSIRH